MDSWATSGLTTFAVLAPWVGLEMLQNVESRASYYNEQRQAARVRLWFERHGAHNPILLVDSGHYFVYKPYFPNLYNPNYLEPGDPIGQYRAALFAIRLTRVSRAQLAGIAGPEADRWQLIDGGEDVVRIGCWVTRSCAATGPGCATPTREDEAGERILSRQRFVRLCPASRLSRLMALPVVCA